MLELQSTTIFSTSLLIGLAEIGDKSQLVCMLLAARHRPLPVLFGASLAFMLLNGLAVTLGATLALWLPHLWITLAATVLFAFFGVQMLRTATEDEEEVQAQSSTSNIFLTACVMIFTAEMGDKTQIAIAGLATTLNPIDVWLGATIALVLTSYMGVFFGYKLLNRIPTQRLHQIAGLFFLGMAALAFSRLF
ncbi:TMEM165/GDT1 family protein [Magnetococcus sp. PR-3]|uniref:TMEM165/GDT1 family protein n=1 Tax=Magnetococcus sp. PR-3 TaxID=3120355 RepID=UPI002FCE1A27